MSAAQKSEAGSVPHAGPAEDALHAGDAHVLRLIEQLRDRDGMVREGARRELVELGEPALLELTKLLESNVKRTRWEAAQALAAIGDSRSIHTLLRLLSDDESDIRWIAALGLIKVGPLSLQGLIEELLDKPDSKRVRRGVHHVLSELGYENQVIMEIVATLRQTLGEMAPTETIVSRAENVLKEIAPLKFSPREKW